MCSLLGKFDGPWSQSESKLSMLENGFTMLPKHGLIECRRCWQALGARTEYISNDSRFKLVNDPAAWGSREPRVLVLGMTKGNTQSNAMSACASGGDFDRVAFAKFRDRLTAVLHIVGLAKDASSVDSLIVSKETDFGWGSVIRCSLTGWDAENNQYSGESGKVLPAFDHFEMKTVLRNCFSQFLSALPQRTRLVVLLGNSDGYLKKMKKIVGEFYSANFCAEPEYEGVAYSAGGKRWVHVAHPSRGNGYFNNFMKDDEHSKQGKKRRIAQAAVLSSLESFANNSPLPKTATSGR